MSRELIIKEVGVAVRCEVCHQADLYNGQTNQCLRCEGLMDMVSLSTSGEGNVEINEREMRGWTSGQVRVGIRKRERRQNNQQEKVYKLLIGLAGVVVVAGMCQLLHQPLGRAGGSFLFSIVMYLVRALCNGAEPKED